MSDKFLYKLRILSGLTWINTELIKRMEEVKEKGGDIEKLELRIKILDEAENLIQSLFEERNDLARRCQMLEHAVLSDKINRQKIEEEVIILKNNIYAGK